ncbi:hypothetical protein U1Q18_001938 [Sarracenia purpurea var. burkii]
MISSWRRRRAARHADKKCDTHEKTGMELIVPSYFRCPISLELMKDPVTLSSGITYDRESIERWIEAGHSTCPITNQVQRSCPDPIPNHTIRKMIQDWCVENKSFGVERIPTPRIPVSSFEVSEILSEVAAARQEADAGDGERCLQLVAKIEALVAESERNRRCFVGGGARTVLSETFRTFSESKLESFDRKLAVLEEILSVLTLILPLNEDSKSHSGLGSSSSLETIVWFLKFGDLSGRRNAVMVLKEIVSSNQETIISAFAEIEGAMEALFKLIKEPICPKTTKASLMTIYSMVASSSSSANQIKMRFSEMDLISLLLEMLVDSDRSMSERALGVLDELCDCNEGRERLYGHDLTVPVLVKKLLRVSDLATDFSVSVIWKLGKKEKREEEGRVMVEALKVGAFQKLLVLLQIGCGERTKEKATEVLKLMNDRRACLVECIDSMDFKHLKRPFL